MARAWALMAVVATTIGLAGCGTGAPTSPAATPSPSATLAPSATPAPTEPFPVAAGKLAPGLHQTRVFEPAVAFELGEGWSGMFADEIVEVAMMGPGNAFLGIERVSKIVDPTSGLGAPAPDDLAAWLAGHPDLQAGELESVTIAGLAGQRVDLVGAGTGDVEIFAFPGGNLRIPAGVTFRTYVLPLDGDDMTIVFGAPSADFDASTELLQPILDSLVLVGS